MSSKFWNVGGAGSSDSESDNSSVSSEDAEEKQQQPTAVKKVAEKSWGDFKDESSSDEEERRVVRSEKDKRWEALRSCVNKLNQHKKNADFVEVHEDFELLGRLIGKAQAIIDNEGCPSFLARALLDLERYVEEKHKDKALLKRCSKQKAQAVNKLQRKLPKFLEPFRETMDKVAEEESEKESADVEGGEVGEDESSEEEEAAIKAPLSSSDAELSSSSSPSSSSSDESTERSSSSSLDSESGSDEESSSSSSDERSQMSDSLSSSSSSESAALSDVGDEADFEIRHQRAMIKWGYKTPAGEEKEKKEVKREATMKRREEAEKRKAAKDKAREEAGPVPDAARRASVLLPEGEAMDEKMLVAKAREVVAARNKRGAERTEQLEVLRRLAHFSRQKCYTQTHLEVLSCLVTLGLDTVQASGLPPTASAWFQVKEDVWEIFSLLAAHGNDGLKLSSEPSSTAETTARDELGSTATRTLSFVERLDDGLTRALQAADAHTKEYKERLTQTVDMIALLWLAWNFYIKHAKSQNVELPETWRTALRLIEHMYYLPERLATMKWSLVQKQLDEKLVAQNITIDACPADKPAAAIESLCRYVFLRAHRHEDKFYQARDLFAGTNFYDIAMSMDVSEQVLYNRALTQIGLAAFRKGLVQQAASALSDICGANRQRELLAQGVAVAKGLEKTAEQEKAERRRLLPAHMHINLDLVESAYNICAMLMEVPSLCGSNALLEARHRQSRFKRALELFDKTTTLSESSREIVMTAAKALQKGHWEMCRAHIWSLKCWQFFHPDGVRAQVQALITEKIKSAALRCYILTYSKLYDAMSIAQVSTMFDLPGSTVYSLVSKMIIGHEISAFWDARSETILINRTNPTRLQLASLATVDKIAAAVEQHESLSSVPVSGAPTSGRRPQTSALKGR